jgi:hypothetical protein
VSPVGYTAAVTDLLSPPAAATLELAAPLPAPRGRLTEALLHVLRLAPTATRLPRPRGHDPVGDDDEALALYLCYELAYRGLRGVDDAWEWEPSLVEFRGRLERRLLDRLRASVGPAPAGPIGDAISTVLANDRSPSLSRHLATDGTAEQFREFAVHRSAYQLKEADPHTWGIPRLIGAPKAAMVRIQFEEYGEGHAERAHAVLFADTMSELGLDGAYGAYLDRLPGATLTGVNVISLFGLHRRWRGALVGHLAGFEMTSVGPNARYAAAARRLGFPERAAHFFDVHVDADDEHQRLAVDALAGGFVELEPDRCADVVFGVQTLCLAEGVWARQTLTAWSAGRSSLLVAAR